MMGVLDVWHPDIEEFIRAKQTAGRLSKFNISVNCTDEFMTKVIRAMELNGEIERAEQALLDARQWCDSNKDDLSFGKGPNIIAFENDVQTLINELAQVDEWNLRFPDTTSDKYKSDWDGDIGKWERKGHPTITYKTISAVGLWNMIMESTYNRAEPGVLFLDRANHFGPLNYAETIFATNPCGEQTLAPGGVCNLGSVNATLFAHRFCIFWKRGI